MSSFGLSELEPAARQKQILRDRVQAFAESVGQIAILPGIDEFDWLDDPTKKKVAEYNTGRSKARQLSKDCVAPVAKAVHSPGEELTDIFTAVESVKLTRSAVFDSVAKIVATGLEIIEPIIATASRLCDAADTATAKALDDVKKLAVESGWPVESFQTEHEFLHYCRRNTAYQAAEAKADLLKTERGALWEAKKGLTRRVAEVREAAAKAALAELTI